MTTDIATRDQGGALAQPSARVVPSLVAQYRADLQECLSLAADIVDTEIVPTAFWPTPAISVGDEIKILKAWEWDPRRRHPKESPEDYLARRRVATATTGGVIHVGATLGHTSYYQSISGIYFVGGRPALMSEEMRAQVIHHGHHIRVTERTRTRAIVECKRRGESGDPRYYPFTIQDAIEAGYVPEQGPNEGTDKWGKPKKGGNPKYLTDPATMLVARATTIACRLEFPDVIRGMVSAETAEDERHPVDITATVTDVTPSAPRADVAAILASAPPRYSPEPEAPEGDKDAQDIPAPSSQVSEPAAADTPPEPEVQRYVMPVSKGKLDLIKAAFERHDLGARATAVRGQRMLVLSALVNREITDPRELTADEGQLVLDNIGRDEQRSVVDDIIGREPADQVADESVEQQSWPEP